MVLPGPYGLIRSPGAGRMGEHTVEWTWDVGEVDGAGEQAAVAVFSAGAASEEAVELVVRAAVALGGLALQDPEGSQLALLFDDSFHLGGAEGVDQLVFQIGGASEEAESLHPRLGVSRPETGPFEAAAEAALLCGVIKTRQPDVEPAWAIAIEEMADVRRAFHGQDADPLGVQVTATPPGQRLHGVPVAQSFDKDDRVTGRCGLVHLGPPPPIVHRNGGRCDLSAEPAAGSSTTPASRRTVTPTPRAALITGKAFAAGMRALTQAVAILLLSAILGVTLTLNPLRWLGVIAIVLLGTAFFSCLSMTIAGLAMSRDRLMGIGQAITMPLFFGSNALYPIDLMPAWLRTISHVNPLSYEVDALRHLLIGTHGNLLLDFGVLIVAAVAGIAAASALLGRLVR
jgi:hypothetical protein